MAEFKLLAIGGSKDKQWLPWDGKALFRIIPLKQPVRLLEEEDDFIADKLPTERYRVYTFINGDHAKRHVYIHETVPSSGVAKSLIKDHLFELFIGVGDIEQ